MKVLNLYAGIGGNRRLWKDVEVTAVEKDGGIALYYQSLFRKDKVIVDDAHEYLLNHYHEFDFIWSSPPCPTHSKMSLINHLSPYKDNSKQLKQGGGIKPRYPDFRLYEEIVFLKHFFKGKYCVENVVGYYEPLIPAKKLHRHYFWSNFDISDIRLTKDYISSKGDKDRGKRIGFDLDGWSFNTRKDTILRNCVNSELGLHILEQMLEANKKTGLTDKGDAEVKPVVDR